MRQADSIRSFIAVPLAADLWEKVEEWQRTFRATGADVRWVPVKDMHFTLKFLGEVALAQLSRVRSICAARAALTEPFTVCLQGAGVFPHPRRPRVVWIGATGGSAELAALAAGLEGDLAAVGFPPEKKPYRAHLTLGRCRSSGGWSGLQAALEARQESFLGEMRVEHFYLMQSELTPQGALYTIIEQFTMGT